MRSTSRLLIDGTLRQALSGRAFDNLNPATEEVIGSAADGGPADVEAAVGAARTAFDRTSWRNDHVFRAACKMQNALPIELIEPQDVSNIIAFLVSDEARTITGSTIAVDAGSMARP